MRKSAEVIIVGGGISGCSIAYNLAKKCVKDIVVLEKRFICPSIICKILFATVILSSSVSIRALVAESPACGSVVFYHISLEKQPFLLDETLTKVSGTGPPHWEL